MESIENYKKRFFNLMESTIGDVRPLITEQLSPDKIREYKAKWSFVNKMDDAEGKKMYQTAIDGNKEIVGKENRYTVDYFNDKDNEKYISQLVTMYDMSHNPKSSELGKSPITKADELGDVIFLSNKYKKEDEWCKKRNLSTDDICVVTDSMDQAQNDREHFNIKNRIEKTGKYKNVEEDLNVRKDGNYYSYSVWKKIA